MFSSKMIREEFVLRSLNVSPFIKPSVTLDRNWYIERSLFSKCVRTSRIESLLNLLSLYLSYVQEYGFSFWDFSRKFDCRMEVISLSKKFFCFVYTKVYEPVHSPFVYTGDPCWYDVINKSFTRFTKCTSITIHRAVFQYMYITIIDPSPKMHRLNFFHRVYNITIFLNFPGNKKISQFSDSKYTG